MSSPHFHLVSVVFLVTYAFGTQCILTVRPKVLSLSKIVFVYPLLVMIPSFLDVDIVAYLLVR